jgi:hypothetical protein
LSSAWDGKHAISSTRDMSVPSCHYLHAHVANKMSSEADEGTEEVRLDAGGYETAGDLGGRYPNARRAVAANARHAAIDQPTPVSPRNDTSSQDEYTSKINDSDQVARTKAHHRRSLHREDIPALPKIPAHFLSSGRPASITGPSEGATSIKPSRREGSRHAEIFAQQSPLITSRPSTSQGERSAPHRRVASLSNAQTSRRSDAIARARRALEGVDDSELPWPSPSQARRRSLSRPRHVRGEAEITSREEAMARQGRRKDEDLFMEVAEHDVEERNVRPISRGGRVASRLSEIGSRRSLPAETVLTSSADRRPRSSGSTFARPSPRNAGAQSDLSRHVGQYRSSSRASVMPEDAISLSGRSQAGKTHGHRIHSYSMGRDILPPRSAERMRSPELPSYGRRRPSYSAATMQPQKTRQPESSGKAADSPDESPAESSEPKQSLPGSTSVESETADTVWDELDDLKSRIKKLELTGKLPPTSGAAVSGETSERPRTATTAPTTIDSSPKVERKQEPEAKPASTAVETGVGGPGAANIHPLLHNALAKAKPLLNAHLYRSLEATASDALQLAVMTGSAGPQGTTFSAASIINGVTVADRHVRRKADTMCRNLTDLTLALCDGKHEAPSVTASPLVLEPIGSSPTIRYPRSTTSRAGSTSREGSGTRPLSRLEARRSSILGIPPSNSSPRESAEDVSASEQEVTPSAQPQLHRLSRASNRLLSARMPRYEDVSGDEDPTVRPPSRAMTDIGNIRSRVVSSREQNSPGQGGSPRLRETLATRRSNASAVETNRELSRVASLHVDTGRRRWARESTPPVLEEESTDGGGGEYETPSQQVPKRRVTSFGQFSGNRRMGDLPNRAASLSQRRQVLVE